MPSLLQSLSLSLSCLPLPISFPSFCHLLCPCLFQYSSFPRLPSLPPCVVVIVFLSLFPISNYLFHVYALLSLLCCHFLIVANQYPSFPLLPSLFAHSSSHLMHPGGTVPHLKGCRCKSCPFCLLEICWHILGSFFSCLMKPTFCITDVLTVGIANISSSAQWCGRFVVGSWCREEYTLPMLLTMPDRLHFLRSSEKRLNDVGTLCHMLIVEKCHDLCQFC